MRAWLPLFVILSFCFHGLASDAKVEDSGLLTSCDQYLLRAHLGWKALKQAKIDQTEIDQLAAIQSSEQRINLIAKFIKQNPENQQLQQLFVTTGKELLNRYENFNFIAAAYMNFLNGSPLENLNKQNLLLIIQILKESQGNRNQGPLHYPNIDSPPITRVQYFFGDLIVKKLKVDPHFLAQDALDFVWWLEQNDILFSKFPFHLQTLLRSSVDLSGFWIYGEIYRAGVLAGKNVQAVEETIVRQFDDLYPYLEEKLTFMGNLVNEQSHFRIPDSILTAVNKKLKSWLQDHQNLNFVEQSEAVSKSDPIIENALANASGALNLREFLTQSIGRRMSGYLLGIGNGVYGSICEFTGLTNFYDGFHKHLMTVRMTNLNDAQKARKVRKYISKIVATGKPIVFLLPPDISKTEYTKIELEYLVEDPQRLRNVTFVFGAYPSEF